MNDVLGTCDGLRKCRVDLKPPAPLALTRWADILSLSSSSGCLEPVDFPCRSSGPSLSKQADAHLMMFTGLPRCRSKRESCNVSRYWMVPRRVCAEHKQKIRLKYWTSMIYQAN